MYSTREDDNVVESSTQFGHVRSNRNRRETLFKEQVEKIFGKSKSISTNDLFRIRNIKYIVFTIICSTINYMLSRGLSSRISTSTKQEI